VPRPDELLPAVLASPDDDLPRLVYADALEEAGDTARAEFIRVQIELSRDPGRVDLRARDAALLAIHGEAWLAPLRRDGEALASDQTHAQFRRGFIDIVWMPAAWFVDRGEWLFRTNPVQELRVVRSHFSDFERLLTCEHLSHLRTLDLSERRLGDACITPIYTSQFLINLNCLRLRACNLTNHGASLLSFNNLPQRLMELDLSLNQLSETVVRDLRIRFRHTHIRFEPPPATD
jgi:uncharacterized protein (TIGR02996 family)